MIKFEFFFDCSSPWTYLAFSRIHSVIEKYNIDPIWKPILVGGVFNEVNKDIYAQRENPNPRKFKYSRKDMQDWAELANIKICLLYTSPSPRDLSTSRMPSSA